MDRDTVANLANILPEDVILDMLAKAIQKYMADREDVTNKRNLHLQLSLAVLNIMSRDMGHDKMMAEADRVHQILQMFKSTN